MIYYPISALVNLIVFFTMMVFIAFHGRTKLHLLYVLMALYTVVWAFFYFLWQIAPNAEMALLWTRAFTIGSVMMPIGYSHFIFCMIGQEKKYKWLIICTYFMNAVFLAFNFTPLMVREVLPVGPFPYWPQPGIMYSISLMTFFSVFAVAVVALYKHYRQARGMKRAQSKIILIGLIISIIGGSTNFPLWYGIPIYPVLNIFTSIFILASGYVIVRHRFMDIKMVLRKSIVFFMSVITVLAVAMTVNYNIRNYSSSVWYWLNTGMLVIILYIFPLIRKYYYRLANKYFFSSLYEPQELIAQLGNKLRYILDVKKIYEYLAEVFVKYIRLQAFGYFTFDPETKGYVSLYNNGLDFKGQHKLPALDEEFVKAGETKTVFLLYEFKEKNYVRYKSLIEHMEAIGAKGIAVLSTKYNPVGLLVLGPKESKDNFTREDMQTLEIISGLAASAIENARLYEETKKKSDDLEALLKMKSGFLRVINHQLNTPVSIMRLSFASIRDKTVSLDQGLVMAEAGLERISNTLNDFWLAYEFEGASVDLVKSNIDIYKLLEKLMSEKRVMDTVNERRLELVLREPDFKLSKIGCDEKMIKHAISNILDNAIYYTPKGKVIVSIALEGKSQDRFAKINISDTGKGISDKDKKILFEKFTRGSVASLQKPDGSGLGLYIAKRITEESGGELKLEHTELGQGTTFSISLPYLEYIPPKKTKIKPTERSTTAPIIEEGGKQTNRKKSKILFIDDDKQTIELFKTYFEARGLSFYSSLDIKDGMEQARSLKPDAIILEIIMSQIMPDGTVNMIAEQGYEFLEAIKKDKQLKHIPVIMFTNMDTLSDRNKAKKLGAHDYLVKTQASPRELISSVKKAIENN